MKTDFITIRIKLLTDLLDKFPDVPTNQLARILYRDYPEFYNSKEHARSQIRYLRGTDGKENLLKLKNRKYVRGKSL